MLHRPRLDNSVSDNTCTIIFRSAAEKMKSKTKNDRNLTYRKTGA